MIFLMEHPVPNHFFRQLALILENGKRKDFNAIKLHLGVPVRIAIMMVQCCILKTAKFGPREIPIWIPAMN